MFLRIGGAEPVVLAVAEGLYIRIRQGFLMLFSVRVVQVQVGRVQTVEMVGRPAPQAAEGAVQLTPVAV